MNMSDPIQQQPDSGFQDKYILNGEGFVWPIVRSILFFMALLPVWITFAMVILDGEFDASGLMFSFVLGWPIAIVNTILLCLLYFFKIDRKPLASAKFCFLECLLFLVVLIFVAWSQDYLAGIFWYEPVEVLFWYSEEATVLLTVLIVFTFYIVKKLLRARSRRAWNSLCSVQGKKVCQMSCRWRTNWASPPLSCSV